MFNFVENLAKETTSVEWVDTGRREERKGERTRTEWDRKVQKELSNSAGTEQASDVLQKVESNSADNKEPRSH